MGIGKPIEVSPDFASVNLFGPVFKLAGFDAPSALVTAVSLPVSIFIVLGACNSMNLIDGLDGLASGVTFIMSLGFFLFAAMLTTFRPEDMKEAWAFSRSSVVIFPL